MCQLGICMIFMKLCECLLRRKVVSKRGVKYFDTFLFSYSPIHLNRLRLFVLQA